MEELTENEKEILKIFKIKARSRLWESEIHRAIKFQRYQKLYNDLVPEAPVYYTTEGKFSSLNGYHRENIPGELIDIGYEDDEGVLKVIFDELFKEFGKNNYSQKIYKNLESLVKKGYLKILKEKDKSIFGEPLYGLNRKE